MILLIVAIRSDVLYGKVSNWIIVAGLFGGIIYRIYQNGIWGVVSWLQGFLLPCVLLFLLLSFAMIGAADIKLLAMIGSIFGITFIGNVIIWSVVFGAILSIIQMVRFQNFFYRFQYLINFITELTQEKKIKPYYSEKTDGKKCVIPFTVPIGIAFMFCLWGPAEGKIF